MDREALEDLFPCVPIHDHADQGEVGDEFRREQERLRKEDDERRRREEQLSEELIRKMQEEDQENERPTASGESPQQSSSSSSPSPPPDPNGQRGTKRKHQEVDDPQPGPSSEVQEQRRALEAIRQLQEDEALAKRLQEEEERERIRRNFTSPVVTRNKTKKSDSGRKKEAAGKPMRQLSISDYSFMAKK